MTTIALPCLDRKSIREERRRRAAEHYFDHPGAWAAWSIRDYLRLAAYLRVSIVFLGEVEEGYLGWYEDERSVIYLSPCEGDGDLLETMAHELVHAIFGHRPMACGETNNKREFEVEALALWLLGVEFTEERRSHYMASLAI